MSALRDKNIRGLDVAMDDAFGVRGVEGVGDLDSQLEQGFEFYGPRTDTMQSHTVEKFHRDEGLAVLIANVVDGADVGMVQGGRSLGFALKSGQDLGIAGDIFGEKFQGNEAMEARVLSFVNDSHAATAELFGDPVVRDGLTNHTMAVW